MKISRNRSRASQKFFIHSDKNRMEFNKSSFKFLVFLFLFLAGCTMDVFVNRLPLNSGGSPLVGGGNKVSIDIQFDSNVTTLYTSTDDENYTLAISNIPGEMTFPNVEKDNNVSEDYTFYMLEKSFAAPSELADKSLWSLNPHTKNIEKIFDLPDSVYYCDNIYEKTNLIHLYCTDTSYEPTAFSFNKTTKVLTPLVETLGYISDSTDVYYVVLLSSPMGEVIGDKELIALYRRTDPSTPNHGELKKVYLYVENSFREVHIEASDLAYFGEDFSIAISEKQHLIKDKKILLDSYVPGNGERPIIILNFSNLNNLSLSYFLPMGSDVFGQLEGNVLLFRYQNFEFEIYAYSELTKVVSRLSATSYVSTFTPFTSNNFLYILDNDGHIKKCTLAGTCVVFYSNFASQGFSEVFSSGSNRYYRSSSELLEIDVEAGVYRSRSDLVNLLTQESASVGDIHYIYSYDSYIIVSGGFDPASKVISKSVPVRLLDSYHQFCSAPIEERDEVTKKIYRYEIKKTKKINVMKRNIECA